jgi:hypothetical protein
MSDDCIEQKTYRELVQEILLQIEVVQQEINNERRGNETTTFKEFR